MRPLRVKDVESELRLALDRGDVESIGRLGKQLDWLDVHPDPWSMLDTALWYVIHGLHVFPLQKGSKVPWEGSHGFEDASTDPARIRRHWVTYPQSNVAIATGHVVDVVDIDGPTGHKSMAEHLLDEQGRWKSDVPILGTVSTPRPGGKHLYVPANPALGNRTHFFPGIDGRALGGYVVAPPSVLDDRPGQYAGRYEWITGPELP